MSRKLLLVAALAATTSAAGQELTTTAETPLFVAAPAVAAQPAVEQFTTFIRSVLQNSPRTRALEAARDAAAAQTEAAAQSLYNPELELEAERTDINTTSIGINQTFDWNGKRKARNAVAGHELQSASARLELGRQQLAAQLLDALGEFSTALRLQRLGNERVTLMRQFAEIADQRLAAGDLDQVEYDLARLAAIEAELEAASLATRVDEAGAMLAALSGERHEHWPELPDSPPSPTVMQTDTDALLQRHPALLAQQAGVDASKATIELRRREARADPAVGLRLGREADNTLTGLTFSIPLFVRNRYQAQIAEARALAGEAEYAIRTQRLELQTHIDTARQRYQRAHEAWSRWQQQGASSLERRSTLLERLWQTGELSTTDYLVQLQQTLDTRSAATELHGRLWRGWAEWLDASGTTLQWLESPALLESSRTSTSPRLHDGKAENTAPSKNTKAS